MKKYYCALFLMFTCIALCAQNIEVDGKAIIHTTDPDPTEKTIIVKQPDGTLAERELDSFLGVEVGDFYQGGIVFFVYNRGQNGLIVSVENLGIDVPWGPTWDDVQNADDNFDGQANTIATIAYHGTNGNYAALVCDNYTYDGYSDWYLPSISELRLIMEEFHKLNILLANDADPSTKPLTEHSQYWSSTQYPDFHKRSAWTMDWQRVDFGSRTKTTTPHKVRAIRKF